MRAGQRRHRRATRALLDVGADDVDGLVAAARATSGVDLVVVGPEAPLVAGLADALADGRASAASGPSAAAARLEGSKAFCKEVMEAAGVPTAAYAVVTDRRQGMAAIDRYPAVIKADGLAAGKGVIIAADEAQAREALEALLVERRFGTERVVVEEHLVGEELSLLALCDGERALPLAPAQDYKRIFDGDARAQHRRHGLLLAGARRRRDARGASSCAQRPPAGRRRAARRGIAVPRASSTPA